MHFYFKDFLETGTLSVSCFLDASFRFSPLFCGCLALKVFLINIRFIWTEKKKCRMSLHVLFSVCSCRICCFLISHEPEVWVSYCLLLFKTILLNNVGNAEKGSGWRFVKTHYHPLRFEWLLIKNINSSFRNEGAWDRDQSGTPPRCLRLQREKWGRFRCCCRIFMEN